MLIYLQELSCIYLKIHTSLSISWNNIFIFNYLLFPDMIVTNRKNPCLPANISF